MTLPARLDRVFAAVLCLAAIAPRLASAAWPHVPAVNVPICTAANDQVYTAIVGDGSGGAIICWEDVRGTSYDIYAQHVLVSGVVDPAWPVNGRAPCTATSTQAVPVITSDGAGGAIVAWYDFRAGTADIYAQRVLASGVVDPAWPLDGRAICTAINTQLLPQIVSDGAGGAIVAWQDFRSGNYDVYAQHVSSSGVVDPAWPVDGRLLCNAVNDQSNVAIATDGAGGAIAAWQDFRGGVSIDIYAQHVTASGAVDPVWPVNGRALCTAAASQISCQLVTDGAGGAIVTWQDARGGAFDIYAQHVQSQGSADPTWPPDGRLVCNAASEQSAPVIVTDGADGAIIAWQDLRSSTSYDVYAQHMLATGLVDGAWPVNGRGLCVAIFDQLSPQITSDGAGGAIVTWQDARNGPGNDIYAQRVQSSGVADPAWPVDGRAVSTGASDQFTPVIASDGAGGAIVAWRDFRGGPADIYAQRVARFGQLGTPEPVISSVRDVRGDQGGKVNVAWYASWLDTDPSQLVDHYWVLRSLSNSPAAPAPLGKSLPLRDAATGIPPRPGAVFTTVEGSTTYFWEYLASVNALHIVDGYEYVAPTVGDSAGSYIPRTYFMVVAWNGPGTQYWSSRPDSGYSVDNLGPATPAPFTGQYNAGNTALHWNPNSEADLAGYRLYRGSTAGFVPGPGNLVVAQSDTGFVDVAGAPYYYKLTAVDLHGNESPPALLLPSGTTDVPSAGLGEIAFAAPAPNPSRTGVVLRIALPREARVSLAVYDVNGARVRTLIAGRRSAGEHPIAWDLRSERGGRVPAGLYFARLEAEGRSWVQRIATLE